MLVDVYKQPGGLQIINKANWVPEDLAAQLRQYNPKTHLGKIVKLSCSYLPAEMATELIEAITRCVVAETSLDLVVLRADGRVEPLGVVSRKVVTDTGVAFIVDALQNLTEIENLNFHGLGTGSTGETAAQAALITELTTQYNPDNTRPAGTRSEPSANVYRTVATITLDGAATIAEHGLFSQAAAPGGVMSDRSQFAGLALAINDSLQATYDWTFTSGG